MSKVKALFFALIAVVLVTGCEHGEPVIGAGKGGAAIVNVYPQHHGVATNLLNFKVYIKYNTLDAAPNGAYDDSLVCTNANNLVSCSFTGLKNGKYYIYGSGTDTSIRQNVKGGAPCMVSAQNEQNFNLPVSE